MSFTTVYHTVSPLNTFSSITGCPILVNSATPVACSGAAPTVVLTGNGSDLAADPYDYLPAYPLLLKVFFTNIVLSGTVSYPNPFFYVKVTGPTSFYCERRDDRDFGLSIQIKNWSAIALDTTITIEPVATLTGVTFDCLAGFALDNQRSPTVF